MVTLLNALLEFVFLEKHASKTVNLKFSWTLASETR